MSRDQSLARQLQAARKELARLTEEAERNSRILAQSQARELSLLRADDLESLFRAMLEGLCESYGLDAVSVTVADPEHEIRHLLLAGGLTEHLPPGLCLVDTLDSISPAYRNLSASWLGPYSKAEHGRLFTTTADPGSVALIPLKQNDRVFAAINFASTDAERFQPQQATDFLDRLGDIAAFAIENAVNRARLRRSGFTDVLTGWYNRRYLLVRLEEELARAKRDAASLSCLMLDIDHFKAINDDYGHAAGDTVLRDLTARIAKRIRATDVAARYGGEEFVILLPATDLAAAAKLAESIRLSVAAEGFVHEDGPPLKVTISIGVAACRPGSDETDFETMGQALIARADGALYRAKSEGRNRVAATDGESGDGA